ncbi:hypothetical protein AQ959_02565 [Burkholderia pseudomallei]|nr:hypothetical protein AQ959_02565 [Burkholderia pseudomallei]
MTCLPRFLFVNLTAILARHSFLADRFMARLPPRRPICQEEMILASSSTAYQALQSLRLYLPHTLPRDPHLLPDLFKCSSAALIQETKSQVEY